MILPLLSLSADENSLTRRPWCSFHSPLSFSSGLESLKTTKSSFLQG